MALLDRVKERSGSDLSDSELQAMIDALTAEIEQRFGAIGPVTIEVGDIADDHRWRETILVNPPIDTAQAITIIEFEPAGTGDAAAETELAAADYRVIHNGRALQRLTGGPNGNQYWAPLAKLTYTPVGVAAARDEVIIKLMMLDLTYRGLVKSERAGDYQWAGSVASGAYAQERESIINTLAPGHGLIMA